MRIAVTGGAGYIGSHVVLDLLEEKHSVLVIDDLSTGSAENVFSDYANYSFFHGDYSSKEAQECLEAFEAEALFHFASLKAAGMSMLYPESYSQHNIRKSFQLIEGLAKSACFYFIFSSSAAVYGSPAYLPLDEQHPCLPINYYGFTKHCIEENLRWFSSFGKIRCAILRYFNAAGYDTKGRIRGLERKPNNLIPIMMEAATGKREYLEIFGKNYDTPDGTCIRDYIHASDLSRAHVLALSYMREKDKDLVLNLGAGRGYSVWESLEIMRRICPAKIEHREAPPRQGDCAQLIASSKKAHELLGWSAQHSSMEEILRSTWNLYEKNNSSIAQRGLP